MGKEKKIKTTTITTKAAIEEKEKENIIQRLRERVRKATRIQSCSTTFDINLKTYLQLEPWKFERNELSSLNNNSINNNNNIDNTVTNNNIDNDNFNDYNDSKNLDKE